MVRPQALLGAIFDCLFPPLCFACGKLLGAGERSVCAACLRSIRAVSPSDLEFQERLAKLASEGTIAGLVAVYYFEGGGTLQSIIHQLKYSGMTSLGVMLGERLGERVKIDLAGETIAGIVPMPLHRSKERERGYNQAECICRGMAAVLGFPVESKVVMRAVHTKTQTKLNSEERKQNVAGAFALSRRGRPRIKDATLLLVDDVVTTGATMQSCASVLIGGGAKRVIACATALAT